MNVALFVMLRHKIMLSQLPDDLVRKILDGDVDRAGGDVKCTICGFQYYNHPSILRYTDLHVICAEKGVKVYKL